MPRRSPAVIAKIPLFLLEAVAHRELRNAGEALVRMVIREMKGHCYSISIRTRAMCRRVFPYKPRLPEMEAGPGLLPGYCPGLVDP